MIGLDAINQVASKHIPEVVRVLIDNFSTLASGECFLGVKNPRAWDLYVDDTTHWKHSAGGRGLLNPLLAYYRFDITFLSKLFPFEEFSDVDGKKVLVVRARCPVECGDEVEVHIGVVRDHSILNRIFEEHQLVEDFLEENSCTTRILQETLERHPCLSGMGAYYIARAMAKDAQEYCRRK